MSPLPPGGPPDPPRRKTIQITLESSDALGPSIRRLANSDAIAITFPRDALCRIADYPELKRRGVYMLIAAIPGPRPLRIYVGEAQDVLKRLQRHERDREYPLYLQISVVVSADNQIRADVTCYVEKRIISALVRTEMVEVENRLARPPKLHSDNRLVAEQFFRDAMLLLGPVEPMASMLATTVMSQVLRNEYLEQTEPVPIPLLQSNVLYELRRHDCHAFAVHCEGRYMRVLAGAKIAQEVHYSLPRRGRELRARLVAAGSLVAGPQDGWLILLRDVDVFSQTGAADLVMGRKTDGSRHWKLASVNLDEESA